jgi:hypothetical protein
MMTPNGYMARRAAALREAIIHEEYDGSQTGIDNTENPAKSSQIQPKNIVFEDKAAGRLRQGESIIERCPIGGQIASAKADSPGPIHEDRLYS